MARPKSEEKRSGILFATAEVIAERGIGAPTSAISAAAGVAEGTLFTYFNTKDELLNALYSEIKLELADVLMSGFPRRASVRTRLQHIWDHFLQWGIANPKQHQALKLIGMWGGLTLPAKTAGSAPFMEIQRMVESAVKEKIIRDLPLPFVAATMQAMQDITLEFMRQAVSLEQASQYQASGFEMLWAAIARKS